MSMINPFKIPIISIKSGIPWMKRNPAQKSFVVLVGEAVAIPPINKANGVAITINPKLIITKQERYKVLDSNSLEFSFNFHFTISWVNLSCIFSVAATRIPDVTCK